MNAAGTGKTRHTRWVVLLFGVIAPLAELASIIFVGQQFGAARTFLLLLAGVVAGGLVLSAQGRKAAATLQQRVAAAQAGVRATESKPATGAGWLVLSGVLLIAPGFMSDGIALLLIVPPVRRLLNAGLKVLGLRWFRTLEDQVVPPGSRWRPGDVVQGDVVAEQRPPRRQDGQEPHVIEGRIVEE